MRYNVLNITAEKEHNIVTTNPFKLPLLLVCSVKVNDVTIEGQRGMIMCIYLRWHITMVNLTEIGNIIKLLKNNNIFSLFFLINPHLRKIRIM
jgi:hypothetical protein